MTAVSPSVCATITTIASPSSCGRCSPVQVCTMVDNQGDKTCNYVLAAMERRDVEKVLQLLLMPGYDINYSSQKKMTPLILASKLGLYSVCEKLLLLGVDHSCIDIHGKTALHHASYHGNVDIVRLLIRTCSNVHSLNHDGDQPLHEAVTGGSLETVQVLIDAGSDVNRPNHVTGSTPLDLAVLHERSEIVATLLKHGANVHHKSRARETALHFAVQVGCTAIIELLLSVGADINAANHLGETPLTIAIQEKKLSIVKFLVEAGCTFNYSDYLSPLCIACRQNSEDIICYLLSEGYAASTDTSLRRFIFLHLEETNPELLAFVYHRCENPLTLKESCRDFLRKTLRPSPKEKLVKVNIPKCLKDWVGRDDIYGHQY